MQRAMKNTIRVLATRSTVVRLFLATQRPRERSHSQDMSTSGARYNPVIDLSRCEVPSRPIHLRRTTDVHDVAGFPDS